MFYIIVYAILFVLSYIGDYSVFERNIMSLVGIGLFFIINLLDDIKKAGE